MITIGYLGDRIGRKWGSVTTVSIMFVRSPLLYCALELSFYALCLCGFDLFRAARVDRLGSMTNVALCISLCLSGSPGWLPMLFVWCADVVPVSPKPGTACQTQDFAPCACRSVLSC